MRICILAFGLCAALAATAVRAHGPQIQITNDNNKIVTRQLRQDGDYSLALTAPKSVYVMPLLPSGSIWYSRPNAALNPVTLQPAYTSGPGLAYGYDQADGGPRLFAAGSILSVEFTDGLKLWNGASFVDAGATQLKGFRGSNAAINSPAENFAVTSDVGPFDSVSLAAVSDSYDAEVHASLRWALLGDGASPTSASPDGVYLLSMQLTSTENGLAASDPYYFVLHKNAPSTDVAAAVNSLGIATELVQAVPEPSATLFASIGFAGLLGLVRRQRKVVE